jgi:hypothetical protein
LVDPNRKADVLGRKPPYVPPDPLTKNQHESLLGFWWIAEVWPKIVHRQNAQGEWHRSIQLNLGRRRWISPGSLVHKSVEQRLNDARLGYKPINLPSQRTVVDDRCANTQPVSSSAS